MVEGSLWAAAMGQTKAVRELIRKGVNKSVVAGIFGTRLCVAAYIGHVEAVVAMLEDGCPLHFDVDFRGISTALHWAAEGGHVEVVREMVVKGCDVNAVDADGCTPLHEAAAFDETEAVCELLKFGTTKSVVAGMFGTPLHQAIAHGHLETVEVLLGNEMYEANFCETELTNHDAIPTWTELSQCNVIDTSNSFGQTPVMWAVRRGQVEMFKVLISLKVRLSLTGALILCLHLSTALLVAMAANCASSLRHVTLGAVQKGLGAL